MGSAYTNAKTRQSLSEGPDKKAETGPYGPRMSRDAQASTSRHFHVYMGENVKAPGSLGPEFWGRELGSTYDRVVYQSSVLSTELCLQGEIWKK